jgi:hypothetical protein
VKTSVTELRGVIDRIHDIHDIATSLLSTQPIVSAVVQPLDGAYSLGVYALEGRTAPEGGAASSPAPKRRKLANWLHQCMVLITQDSRVEPEIGYPVRNMILIIKDTLFSRRGPSKCYKKLPPLIQYKINRSLFP